MTLSFNRTLLERFLGGVLSKLPTTMNEFCHAQNCLLAMVIFLQAGASGPSTAALRLQPTTMAAILRCLQTDLFRTIIWECTPDQAHFRLLDISAITDSQPATAVFTAAQLRDAVRDLPDTISIVYYSTHYTIFHPLVRIQDLDNTLMELSRGLVGMAGH
jgi:hypothetical protein